MTFEEECIEALNNYRRRHSADELRVKTELSRHAQEFAKRLALSGKLRHSNNRKYGENVACTTNKKPTGDDIASIWYNEISKYDFSQPGPTPGTGQFTQTIWRSTTHVGVGIASSPKGTFVVANFFPVGNITNPGYFEKNVVPLEGAREQVASTSTQLKEKQNSSTKNHPTPASAGDVETWEEVETKGNVETRTITTVRQFTEPGGRIAKEKTRDIITTITKNGRKSTSRKRFKDIEFEETGKEIHIKTGTES